MKTKNFLLTSFLLFLYIESSLSQVGIGTDVPAASAQLDVYSKARGFLMPRMTTVQRDAITNPVNGLQIYNTTTNCIDFYNSTGWNEVCAPKNTPINYGTFCSSVNQFGSSSNQLISFNQTIIANGLSLVNGGKSVKFAKKGLYNVSLSLCIYAFDDDDSEISTVYWLTRNNVTFPFCKKYVEWQDTDEGIEATLEFQVFVNQNDSIQFYHKEDGTNSDLISIAPVLSPASSEAPGVPSVMVNIYEIVNPGGYSTTNNTDSGNIGSVPTYAAGSVFCASGATAIVDVTNPTTGKTWMDRNLGASQAATSSTDAAAYGDLYQWGRGNDGHQCRTSATTTTLSSNNQPGHGNFIVSPNSPNDWRSPQNTNLWQGVNGVNNPCPIGYRVPTSTELNAELVSWSSSNAAGAFASPLKLPAAGYRDLGAGLFGLVDTGGYYWSNEVQIPFSSLLYFLSGEAYLNVSGRANGGSIRCIKN